LADRLAAYAEATGRSVSTTAAVLITNAMVRMRAEGPTAVARSGGTLERSAHGHGDASLPRWEWPVGRLLTDVQWWGRWLPQVNELMGRRLAPLAMPARHHTQDEQPALVPQGVDERGYSDLMTYLFPPVACTGITLTWRSIDYPAAAKRVDKSADGATWTSARADVWEPVIRHVAEALCALEATGQPGADPYLRMRAEAEIVGPWVRILRYLVGDEEPQLPRRRLA